MLPGSPPCSASYRRRTPPLPKGRSNLGLRERGHFTENSGFCTEDGPCRPGSQVGAECSKGCLKADRPRGGGRGDGAASCQDLSPHSLRRTHPPGILTPSPSCRRSPQKFALYPTSSGGPCSWRPKHVCAFRRRRPGLIVVLAVSAFPRLRGVDGRPARPLGGGHLRTTTRAYLRGGVCCRPRRGPPEMGCTGLHFCQLVSRNLETPRNSPVSAWLGCGGARIHTQVSQNLEPLHFHVSRVLKLDLTYFEDLVH